MKKQTFYLKKYDWEVTILYDIKKEHLSKVIKSLKELKAPQTIVYKAIDNIVENKQNNGITYSNNHSSIVIIGNTSNKPNFANTLIHEIFHLAIHIAREYDITPYGEEIAYISGKIGEITLPIASQYLCCQCHKH
jgi:Zn-dependent peptidase ImmA (M78 family)